MNCSRLALTASFLWIAPFLASVTTADPPSEVAAELEEVKQDLTSRKYLLQYKYQPGEMLRYEVEHLATVDTTIGGNNQKTKLRSRSTKLYRVEDVTEEGQMKFVHVIEEVDMWSEVGGRNPISYNSRKDETAPPEYERVAETIGVPISVVTIDPQGNVVQRKDHMVQPDLGMGGLTIPLPAEAVPEGYKWSVPQSLQVRLEDQRIKTIKTRQLYQLVKVSAGVATIKIDTQVLTPVQDTRVKAQLVQRLSHGEVRFDIDHGRMISKRLDWDENVLAFNGPDSNMKYLARFTETLKEPQEDAPAAQTASGQDSRPRR